MEKQIHRLSISVFSGEKYEIAKFASEKIREKLIQIGFDKVENGMAEFLFQHNNNPPSIVERSEVSKGISIDYLCDVEDYVNSEIRKYMENLQS